MFIGPDKEKNKMDLQMGERVIKNCKQNYTIPHAGKNYTIPHAENTFELAHTTVPYGEKTPRACSRYQPEGKNPQIASREERTTCTGTN